MPKLPFHSRRAEHSAAWATWRTAAALIAIALLTTMASAQTPSSPRLALTMHVPVPPAAIVTDGLHRLLYELQLENRGDVTVTLSSVEIHADSAQSKITLDGDRLIRALDAPADRKSPLAIAGGQRRVLYVDLGETRPARAVRHVFRSSSPIGEGTLEVAVDPAPPVVLGAPLAGGPWAAVYHSDWARGHRRVFYTVDGVTRLPGRYTIDFVKLDDAGRTAHGDDDVVEEALGYGADVLAVSDATVAAVRDDMPEAARVSARAKHRQEDAAGNYVSLDLGRGRFAVYEHLKPGTVRVRPGQRVRRGAVIAQVGFTGDSTGPHLHLHVGDAASPLAAEGRPFVFDRFEVLGRYPEIEAMGKTRWQADGASTRQHERPGPNVVVDFGPRAPAATGQARTTQLDATVQAFLDRHRGTWRDLNVPESDGRLLHDLILERKFTRALEIGTSTGHSGVWIAWALAKTGGKLTTVEIDPERHRTALANFKEAGLASYIDARLGDAHEIVPALSGPFDFVFSDADKDWYKNYLVAVWPKMAAGGCFTAHNVSGRGVGPGIRDFLDHLRTLSDAATTIDTSSSAGVSISCKRK